MAKNEEYIREDRPLHDMLVIDKKEIAPNVYMLSFPKTSDTFISGQVVHVSVNGLQPKLYSLCSSPKNDYMSILFNVVEEGTLTPKLAKLKGGDTISVSKPFGDFYLQEGAFYWIATGTGISPFRSMMSEKNTKDGIVLHGGKKLENFYFAKEFQSSFGEKYIRCCTQENSNDVYCGRLTQYLREQNSLPKDWNYYLCGIPQMIVQVRDILISKGIPFNNIISEIYF